MAEPVLEVSVTMADGSGPVIAVSGEADSTTVAPLREVVTALLSRGTRQLTIDGAALAFVDSTAIRLLVLAALTLNDRGGGMVLLHPQQPVAWLLALTGADQVITVHGAADPEPQPSGGTELATELAQGANAVLAYPTSDRGRRR